MTASAFGLITSIVPRPERQPRDEGASRPVWRILVADDNVDSADYLAVLLRIIGNEVVTAQDGLETVELAEKFLPDVILLDIGMPRLSGYDAARRIREQSWGKNMLLVALTGWGQVEYKQRAREAGFDRHLIKPIDPDALAEMLAGLHQKDQSAV